MNHVMHQSDETYGVENIEDALRTLMTALIKAKSNPSNSMLPFAELNSDVNTLASMLGRAKSTPNGSVSFHDVDGLLPRVAYWIRRAMIETKKIQNILYVDNQPFLSKINSGYLINQGYNVESTDMPVNALARINYCNPDLVILDEGLSGIGCAGLVKALRERGYPGKIIVMTSEAGDMDLLIYQKNYVDLFLIKPIGCNELLKAILSITCGRLASSPLSRATKRLRTTMKRKKNR